jgi:glycosyltransferase involved in cell wall biosynthesis
MMVEHNKSIVFVLAAMPSGGAERVASMLINYWYQLGWNITLIIGHDRENDFYRLPDDIDRIVIPAGSPSGSKVAALLKNIPYVLKLRKALKSVKSPTVLSFLTRTNIHTILASLGLNKRVIISERNDTTREEHPWPWPVLRKWLYKFADKVTANSEIAVDGMRDYVQKEKLAFIPNPVIIPAEMAKPSQSRLILNVGRLVPQKAQHLILEALAKSKPVLEDGWKLEILGEGGEEQKLKAIIEKHSLQDVVSLCGVVGNIEAKYRKAAIFVLSSHYEGTPNALLEAMSYGLPCVVSDSQTGSAKLITHRENGLIFTSGDSADLADKMLFLINNPDKRSEIGNQARKTVDPYSIEVIHSLWEKVFFRIE